MLRFVLLYAIFLAIIISPEIPISLVIPCSPLYGTFCTHCRMEDKTIPKIPFLSVLRVLAEWDQGVCWQHWLMHHDKANQDKAAATIQVIFVMRV